MITPNFLPNENILKQIKSLKKGEALVYKDEVIAANINIGELPISQISKMIDIGSEELLFLKSY